MSTYSASYIQLYRPAVASSVFMELGSFFAASSVALVLTVDFGLFHSSVRLACWGGAGFAAGGMTKNFPRFFVSSGEA